MTPARASGWIAVVLLVVGGVVASAPAATPPPTNTAGGSAASASARGLSLRANLDSAKAVPAPSVASPSASGTFRGTLKSVVRPGEAVARWRLAWSISDSGLTGPMTQATIRSGKAGETGPVLVTLCGPCRPTSAGGVALYVTSGQADALRTSPLYVNVATAANPSGEIRGQVARTLPSRLRAPTSTNRS